MAITVSLRKFIGLIAYPPGTIYTCASDIDPAEMWGGEWEKLTGTFLWAADEERPVGSTGGDEKHQLAVNEMPKHNHEIYLANAAGSTSYGISYTTSRGAGFSNEWAAGAKVGGDQPHNNMPPYLSVNMWKRLTAFSSGGGYILTRLKAFFKGGVCYGIAYN